MNKKNCKEALEIYKKFLSRMDSVKEFLKVAEVGIEWVPFVVQVKVAQKGSTQNVDFRHHPWQLITEYCPLTMLHIRPA